MITATQDQIVSFRRESFLLLRGSLSSAECDALRAWVEDLETRPEAPGMWMKYFERSTEHGDRQLCRVENFLDYHAGLREVILRPDLLATLGALMGEPPLLFKEKINYKLPGGGAFAPHQDAGAFRNFGQSYHVTVLIGVDESTPENGCLEIGRGAHAGEPLPEAEDGTLAAAIVASLVWEPLPTQPGDVLVFDSFLPHRSGPNRSQRPRRALYVTYNRASEGNRRDEYFTLKRRTFPPECERAPGWEPPPESRTFNLGNPIR
jgi:hypothetical protein